MKTSLSRLVCVVLLGTSCSVAGAQNNPAKPVRVIIAQAAGSARNVVSRTVGMKLREAPGQSIAVDARPGEGGTPVQFGDYIKTETKTAGAKAE
jgi:tripartite-type tricarboxylate transporter receptor subunit TctC